MSVAHREPPYVKGMPLLGTLPWVRRDPLGYNHRLVMTHGHLVRKRLGPVNEYLITRPEYLRHVLVERAAIYPKSLMYQRLRPAFGLGLVTADGDLWRANRRTIQPLFRRQRLAGLVPVMAESTTRMVQRWERERLSGPPMDMVIEMTRVTEEIMIHALFGDSGDDESSGRANGASDWVLVNEEVGHRMLRATRLLELLPAPQTVRFNRALARRKATVRRMIAARRAADSPGEDLLGMLLSARDEETGRGLPDQQIQDEVMTMFFAGHETTALALSWFWYLVAQHRDVQRAIQREADGVLTGSAEAVDAETVGRLTYTAQVLKEAMRLYPPVPWFSRTPTEDDTIDGYRIRAGSLVNMMPWITHRHPDYWDEPERFDPARFEPSAVASRDKLAYLPFGAGARQCIGTHFAMLEAPLVAALIASRFHVELVAGHPVRPEPLITLRPAGGVHVRLRPRFN